MQKRVLIIILCLLLAAIVVFADDGQVTCTDSDNGPTDTSDPEPFIAEKGVVKYGLTEKYDDCVSNEDGYHLDPSQWVREYFCSNVSGNIQRVYKDYDCTRYGYTKCEGGKCIGKASTGTNATHAPRTVAPGCGNKKVEVGEQCDPPDKICYDANGNIGICTRPNAQGFGGCQCKLYKGGGEAETLPAANATTPAPTPPPAQPPAQPPAAQQPPAQPSLPSTETQPAEKERAPLPTEDLDESKGIGITRSITNAVKRFFRWIGSWFG